MGRQPGHSAAVGMAVRAEGRTGSVPLRRRGIHWPAGRLEVHITHQPGTVL